MSVLNASIDVGKNNTHDNKIVMKVTTSDGYSATYTGENDSLASMSREIDGAMMRVVHEMLMDPKIVEFLTK